MCGGGKGCSNVQRVIYIMYASVLWISAVTGRCWGWVDGWEDVGLGIQDCGGARGWVEGCRGLGVGRRLGIVSVRVG